MNPIASYAPSFLSNLPTYNDRFKEIANKFLDRYPVDQYPITHPIYQDLVQLYDDTVNAYQSLDRAHIVQLLKDRELPLVDLNTKQDLQSLLQTILKNYTLRKIATFLEQRARG